MADAVIVIEASNPFGLHANFKTSGSAINAPLENKAINDELGNVACQLNIADIINTTQSGVGYCGTDVIGDLGTFLTTFGDVQNSILMNGLTINMTAGEYATFDFVGHQHDTNPHETGLLVGRADVSDFLPHEVAEAFKDWNGFGVPDFGITTGANSSPNSATATFSMNHVDQMDEAGKHLVGKNITPRCELTMDFIGVPTSNTPTLLEADFDGNTNDMLSPLVDSTDTDDSNADFDTFAFGAHANTDLETA
jgi:hypothetical protein